MIKLIKRLIIKIVGRSSVELLNSKPFLANGRYRAVIKEFDSFQGIIKKGYSKDAELATLLARKYAHIIDKGLHRSDVSPGHSKQIAFHLEKSLEAIGTIEKEILESDDTLVWAKEKLDLYKNLQKNGKIDELKEINFKSKVDFDSFIQLIKSRRSNRQFIAKSISDEILFKLAGTVNWASSSCNKQPIKIFATNNSNLAKICLKQCKGGTGFSDYIPCFVAFCADMRGYYLPEEMFLPYIDVSLGVQNFFVSMGFFDVSGTALSWALKSEQEERVIRNTLEIPESYQIVFCAVLGYSKKEYIQPKRKRLEQTLKIVK